MKIRQDYVTNSSSTSFILSSKEAWSKDVFLKAIGVEGPSPMTPLFQQLYEAMEAEKQELTAYLREYEPAGTTPEHFLREEGFSRETIETVERLLAQGRTVYYGRLHSDGDTASEVFFCCESFLVCDDALYFNGHISMW